MEHRTDARARAEERTIADRLDDTRKIAFAVWSTGSESVTEPSVELDMVRLQMIGDMLKIDLGDAGGHVDGLVYVDAQDVATALGGIGGLVRFGLALSR